MSADEFLALAPPESHALALRIRAGKRDGARPRPSTSLVDHSARLKPEQRRRLLDAVAALVDENLFGRSDHANFYRRGIPSAFLFTGLHEDYHRPTDTVEKINVEKMLRIGRYMFLVAHGLAQGGLVRPETK